MIWNLTCRKTRLSLALRAGNDLDEPALVETDRHLAACPQCRGEWQRLQAGQQALEMSRAAAGQTAGREAAGAASGSPGLIPFGEREGSIWPEVFRRIRVVEQSAESAGGGAWEPGRVGWRSWLPLGSLAAACVVVVVGLLPGPEQLSGSNLSFGPARYQMVGDVSVPVEPPDREELGNWSLPPDWRDGPRVRMLIDGTPVGALTGALPDR